MSQFLRKLVMKYTVQRQIHRGTRAPHLFLNNQYFFIIYANTIFHKYNAFNLSSKPVAPFFGNSGSASAVTLQFQVKDFQKNLHEKCFLATDANKMHFPDSHEILYMILTEHMKLLSQKERISLVNPHYLSMFKSLNSFQIQSY